MTSVQEANAIGAHHDAPGTLENHDADLVEQTKGLSINGGSRPASRAASRPASLHPNGGAIGEDHKSLRGDESVYSQDHLEHEQANEASYDDNNPSRSYAKPIPIVTTYESDVPDNASIQKRSKSTTGSRAPSIKAASVKAPSVKGSKAPSVKRSGSRAGSVKAPSVRANSVMGSPDPAHDGVRSGRNSVLGGAAGAAAVGEVFSHERQQQMQQPGSNRVSLHDAGAVSRGDRNGALSPRPRSQFGHRPEPRLMSVQEDGGEAQYDGRESRSGVLGRSGTVISRANTMGRNGTLSRTANGGIAGSRRGAFGRGAGTSIGTQPEEVLGRDDIHSRAELSERILGESALKRLSTMERKDAGRLAKIIRTEAKAEAKAVQGSIKELERLVKLQKEAASQERKSQGRLTKWTSKEHKARLRFLKEKERYEKIEGELRNAENDYEERRDHAAGLTAQVAEDLDDLRAQKAADDREREVKLLALRNPAHS